MLRWLVHSCFIAILPIGISSVAAEESSLTISTPQDGAKVKAAEKLELAYEVVKGGKGDHVHLYLDGKEVTTLHKTKGTYELQDVSAGAHDICIKVVNKGHTPVGLERCVKITAE